MNNLTLQQLYEYAQLATATYIIPMEDIKKNEGFIDAEVQEFDTYYEKYIASSGHEKQNRLPEALANALFNPKDSESLHHRKWSIPKGGYYGNDDEGFAAALYQSEGETVLAIRGTEPDGSATDTESQMYQDLVKADIWEIGTHGFSSSQAIQMINMIEEMSAVDGEYQHFFFEDIILYGTDDLDAQIEAYEKETGSKILPIKPHYYEDDGGGYEVARLQVLRYEMRKTEKAPLLTAGSNIKVVGHSLGGCNPPFFNTI